MNQGSKLALSENWPISSKTGSKFGLFGGIRVGLKFSFGGRTWVQVSSKFDLSSLKQFEVRYIWVRSNTILGPFGTTFNIFYNVDYMLR